MSNEQEKLKHITRNSLELNQSNLNDYHRCSDKLQHEPTATWKNLCNHYEFSILVNATNSMIPHPQQSTDITNNFSKNTSTQTHA